VRGSRKQGTESDNLYKGVVNTFLGIFLGDITGKVSFRGGCACYTGHAICQVNKYTIRYRKYGNLTCIYTRYHVYHLLSS